MTALLGKARMITGLAIEDSRKLATLLRAAATLGEASANGVAQQIEGHGAAECAAALVASLGDDDFGPRHSAARIEGRVVMHRVVGDQAGASWFVAVLDAHEDVTFAVVHHMGRSDTFAVLGWPEAGKVLDALEGNS